MELARLDFQQLRIKHFAFKSKVRSVLHGGNYDKGYFQSNNPVTQWFVSTGNVTYSNDTELEQLRRLHREFSYLADKVVEAYRSDLFDQAQIGFEKLIEISEMFLSRLSDLELKYS
ncbi:histidine kinase [Pontibacter diazotrophicus]|uniref:Histidine kinase n=1 Tax=Pontibacter diazotrophicus TaxID=1400979 RepID=A0A3D8L393_9BACT|nr:histidine kinase [Pontibacter diazotrophicus]RDV11949.1 histidine kinase [Pontibacter diazotrophicus]